MRWILLLAVLPLLGACNMVTSEQPLFTPSDAAGAPPLRDGLWLAAEDGCRVNTRKPVQTWPDCASWFLVQGDRTLHLVLDPSQSSWQWSPEGFLLAAGEPRILQVNIADSIDPTTTAVTKGGYGYFAVEPTARDAEGRIVAYRQWGVLCGPPPLDEKGKPSPVGQTDKPFPGLVLKDDGNCLASLPGTVRDAATASQPFSPSRSPRWIRERLP